MGLDVGAAPVQKNSIEQVLRDPVLWWDDRAKNHPVCEAPSRRGEFKTASQLVAALKRCGKAGDLEGGKKLHLDAAAAGIQVSKNNYVAATLIRMYSKCRSLAFAREVFDDMIHRDVVTWTSLITGYVENGERSAALDLFFSMDCEPDSLTYVTALKSCGGLASEKQKQSDKEACLQKGIEIHKRVADRGLDSELFVASSLVDMYSKCGSMDRARKIFDNMVSKDVVTWNSLMFGYVQNGDFSTAMDLFTSMGCRPSSVTYIAALKACTGGFASEKLEKKQFWFEKGISIHRQVEACSSFGSDLVLQNTLLDMYSKCGSMKHAREVFDRMAVKNVVSWTSLIQGYVENGERLVGINLFSGMDCDPNSITCIAALKACGGLASENESEMLFCLKKGAWIHRLVKDYGFESDMFVASSLVDMYSKCGSMDRAREVFDSMSAKDIVTWNTLILGYVQNGQSSVALELYSSMDCEADSTTCIAALKACGSLACENDSARRFALETGLEIHNKVNSSKLESEMTVASTLVDMYCKCGSMRLAREVFDRMASKDVVSWNALILGYLQNGQSVLAMDLFGSIDCEPNSVTYVTALKCCGAVASAKEAHKEFCLEKGLAIHKQVKARGFESNMVVGNSLLDMYSKCGSMDHAREVFDGMTYKNAASWNHLIFGYVENGKSSVAMDLITAMDCEPDSFTYVVALKACGCLASENELRKDFWLQKGIEIHNQASSGGFESDLFVASTLVDMYSKCGTMDRAKQIFDSMKLKDVVTWNSLILGYVQNNQSLAAMDLFTSMDCTPSSVSFIAALKACGGLATENETEKQQLAREKGIMIHKQVEDRGFGSDLELASSLVDMYSKCGCMDQAREVFDRMVRKDVVTWTSLIQGYLQQSESLVAMDLFAQMDCEPDSLTYVTALKACGNLAALSAGEQIHGKILKLGLENDGLVAKALMDLYGRCGSTSRAEELFNNVQTPDAISWNTLISGYSFSGEPSRVFSLANEMQQAGLQIDSVTFVSILTACSHAGLVDKGKEYFHLMLEQKNGISPTVEHYTCMIDMLGRANRLQEAFALINSMPFEADAIPWKTLLGACKKWKNLEVGKAAFNALVAMDKADPATYVLMSDLCKR